MWVFIWEPPKLQLFFFKLGPKPGFRPVFKPPFDAVHGRPLRENLNHLSGPKGKKTELLRRFPQEDWWWSARFSFLLCLYLSFIFFHVLDSQLFSGFLSETGYRTVPGMTTTPSPRVKCQDGTRPARPVRCWMGCLIMLILQKPPDHKTYIIYFITWYVYVLQRVQNVLNVCHVSIYTSDAHKKPSNLVRLYIVVCLFFRSKDMSCNCWVGLATPYLHISMFQVAQGDPDLALELQKAEVDFVGSFVRLYVIRSNIRVAFMLWHQEWPTGCHVTIRWKPGGWSFEYQQGTVLEASEQDLQGRTNRPWLGQNDPLWIRHGASAKVIWGVMVESTWKKMRMPKMELRTILSSSPAFGPR